MGCMICVTFGSMILGLTAIAILVAVLCTCVVTAVLCAVFLTSCVSLYIGTGLSPVVGYRILGEAGPQNTKQMLEGRAMQRAKRSSRYVYEQLADATPTKMQKTYGRTCEYSPERNTL